MTNGDGAGGDGAPPLVVLEAHHEALPRRARQRRGRSRAARRRGPRADRRERRRQVHADARAVRHVSGRRRAGSSSAATRSKIGSPRDAIALGIGMVHQHFVLVDPFTVTENIILGEEGGARLDIDAARQRVAELAESYGFRVDPRAVVEDLSVGEEQRVEILKALYRGVEILILDEPTAVLDAERDEGSVRQPPQAPGGRAHDRLHQPQARRGARDRRSDHGAAPGPRRRRDARRPRPPRPSSPR